MTFGLCNPEYYRGAFWKFKIYEGERRRYGGARRNSPKNSMPQRAENSKDPKAEAEH